MLKLEQRGETGQINMPNLVKVNYEQTGKSKKTNEWGMREMQAEAYEGRTAQYLVSP